ncbi:N-acetylglucosamine kinase [Propionibacteriaceae bacterium Y2011]
MPDPGTVVALDVGQSGTRLALSGNRNGITLPGLRGDQSVADQLAGLVVRACEIARDRGAAAPTTVAIGSTGVESPTVATEVATRLPGPGAPTPATAALTTMLIAHDSVTSHLGALAGEPGCVLAVGTGVVALGVGTTTARVDGWGSLVGDAGSGHWIGRAAVEAVLRAEDGRGAPTTLRDRVADRFDGLDALGVRLQQHPDRVRLIASVARDVAELAGTDRIAAKITDDAGRELSQTVHVACRRAGLLWGGLLDTEPAGPIVVTTGNALASQPLRDAFETHLQVALPNRRRHDPAGDALTGAGLLPGIGADTPLGRLVSRAVRR